MNHGYLAVDFFFVLSGFVVGYAYDDRWNRMALGGFFKRRLVRLHPMILVGSLIGAMLFYFGDAPIFPLVMQTPWWEMLLLTLLGCLMLPALPSMDIRGWAELNSLNGASWSLMWEYIANILYALFIRRFPTLLLSVFVALSALLTIDIALNIDVFGLLEVRSYAQYTVIGGFGLSADQLYIGLSRLLYPFFAGLLLSRMGWHIRVKRGFWWCSLLIAAILVMPYVDGGGRPWVDGAYNAVAILLLFPLIVSMGAGSTVTGRRSVAVCKFLGDISYPLYITHYPWIYVQMNWAARHPEAPLGTHICVAVSLFILVVAIAYACLKLYDEPVREWLKRNWLMKKKCVVTRPFKLGYPDVLKTIDTVIQRGYFRNGHVAQVLYGSRDLFNWHIIWSSTDKYLRGFRGTPYKYFRLALICRLDKAECIDGCTVQFTPRLTNRPR